MGFLNSNTQVVDAILTRYGRDKLASGQSLGISRFALSDDGVDYDLWNTAHNSGSGNFGEAIENMPVLEAFPDEEAIMTYRLENGPRNIQRKEMIYFTSREILVHPGESAEIIPKMANARGNANFIFKLGDDRYATFVEAPTRAVRRPKRAHPDSMFGQLWGGGTNGQKSIKVKGIHKQESIDVKVTVYNPERTVFGNVTLKIIGTEDNTYSTYYTTGDR